MKTQRAARAIEAMALASCVLGPLSAEAAFPGKNGKIAFVSFRDLNFEIYVVNADGTGLTRLTNNTAVDGPPSWSPDGSKIAFNSMRDGNSEIYVMNADGGAQTRLTFSGGAAPSWSPDGTRITFQSSGTATGRSTS